MFYSKSCLTKAINILIPIGQILLYVPFGTSWTIKLKSTIEFVNVELYFQRSINADWFDSVCVHFTCQSKYNRKKTTEYNQVQLSSICRKRDPYFSNLAQHARTPVCMHSKGKNTTKNDNKSKKKIYIKPCKNILKKSETVLKNCL